VQPALVAQVCKLTNRSGYFALSDARKRLEFLSSGQAIRLIREGHGKTRRTDYSDSVNDQIGCSNEFFDCKELYQWGGWLVSWI
jgi:hypothetical protein